MSLGATGAAGIQGWRDWCRRLHKRTVADVPVVGERLAPADAVRRDCGRWRQCVWRGGGGAAERDW